MKYNMLLVSFSALKSLSGAVLLVYILSIYPT